MEVQELEQLKGVNSNLKNKMTETKKPKIKEKEEKKIVVSPNKETKKMSKEQEGKKENDKKSAQKAKETNSKETEKSKQEDNEKIKQEPKKEQVKEIKKKKLKKEAIVNTFNAHLSTKISTAVCKFITKKGIDKAIKDLEEVLSMKKAVPMKGEIPHRKGKGMMSGRYPKNATKHFIKLLKSLYANANFNGIENPFVAEAIANIGSRPYGKFGRVRRKRTHIKIIAKEKRGGKK